MKRAAVRRRLEDLICPSCWRWRFSPIHWLQRAAGWCPGEDNYL